MRAKVISSATASGVLGGIGSVPNACHSLCMSVVSLLSVFGVTLNILPLMFLQTYQLYFWSGALAFTGASYYFYHKQRAKVNRDRNFLTLNSGLLLFGLPAEALAKVGLPFSQLADYMDFFRFFGGWLAVVGVFLFIFGKKFQPAYRPVASVEESVQQIARNDIMLPKVSIQSLLFVIVIGGFLVNQYLMYRIASMGQATKGVSNALTFSVKPASRMKLTSFDVALAKERMDKNNDGICDVCGMPIQQCIDSGQLDCNMSNDPNAIGVLGSQHIHADFKVYMNGQALDFAKPEYFMKSSFMHVDNNPNNKEDASGVLHMHATKVPLWLFFKSIGMNVNKGSTFYLNGKKVDSLENYVFQDLDKILISYGPENDQDIERQITSITNFAKDHQK